MQQERKQANKDKGHKCQVLQENKMLSRPKGQQQSSSDQPKEMFGSGQRELEGGWRTYLGRETRSLSPRERELALPQAEALARQTDVLHHLFQIPICLREMIMR